MNVTVGSLRGLDIRAEIDRLRKERNAVILAHYYQEPGLQDIADFVGDSLDLSRKAAATAVTMRANTGWHRRLMYCSFAILTGPGIGRLTPNPLLEPYAWWIGAVGLPLIFPVIGMIADKRRYGRVHPAWFWGIGLVIGVQAVADLVAYSDWGVAFTKDFIAGTPGAERSMQAFLPPA